ncbi:hypothetical protein [[Mycobacterium] wendilense]|uniref:Uncharacterized protein n=1 Tax=[Mycobacterium] wendilense TaxID=3064284 RepID=A0ABN9P5E6_9MYCO|nr:hypothetical protein [Mycolicibacterium sp. MU0050]CAJ1584891.1 hypothetical protein MU0050_003428 [Mycolicibacterium sp. MU0050]
MPTVGRNAARTLAVAGAFLLAASLAVMTPGLPAAQADVYEVEPNPTVSSRQADAVAGNSTHGGVRSSRPGVARGAGEVRGSMKAVPGRDGRAAPFQRGRYNGPGMGAW